MRNYKDIDSLNLLDLIKKANDISLKKHSNTISLERAIFLSWYCDKGDCAFCYMSTQKDKIQDPKKAKRRIPNILAEAEMCKRLEWNIEFLSGGYKSFKNDEIKNIALNIKKITSQSVWLNTGITNELEIFDDEITGITGAVETANPTLHNKLCPSKPLEDISEMLDKSKSLKFKNAITIILGLGETIDDLDYLIQYIKDHKIDRVIFYSLNPHKETIFANSSAPSSLYYAQIVSTIRINFPKIEIICGTWIDNLANIGILILSGANGITKFPLFKMFGTRYGKRVEDEIKFTGRKIQGTFTDNNKLEPEKSQDDEKLNKYIERYINESLKNKYD